MDFLSVFVIAVGLAMDAFAVSISCGFTVPSPKRWNAMKIAASFGAFQAIMPVIGWSVGRFFSSYIEAFDHWIAFILLGFIGIRMIYNAIASDKCETVADPTDLKTLLILSIATSIDALAVGVTFAFLQIHIISPVLIIGIITFLISSIGLLIGHKLGRYFEKRIEIFGGVVLIGIGIKILIEHLFF
ncbi:MAG: manganese efflux pump MntP family protein [Candidatus Marinimicrobia bacterium]|nr:manganese efflux pump MntP family protein [Candidatus Neomarinimicrobiota bacterium]